jgi:hypothetical protein
MTCAFIWSFIVSFGLNALPGNTGPMTQRKPDKKFLLMIALAHLTVTAVTWRDIGRRPAREIRGSKTLWRILSGANTTGSLAYVLVGRRWVGGR